MKSGDSGVAASCPGGDGHPFWPAGRGRGGVGVGMQVNVAPLAADSQT